MIEFTVEEHEVGLRLDQVVAARIGVSVNEVRRLLDDRLVRLDPGPSKKSTRVGRGAHVRVMATPTLEGDRVVAAPYSPVAQPGTLPVLHADEAIVVVNKPVGMATHPLKPGELGTAANLLAALYPECASASTDPRDGGFVHRLDHDTSGVLVAARTRATYEALRRSFTDHEVDKVYWALVHGVVSADPRAVESPLVTRNGTAKIDYEDPRALSAKTVVRALATGNDVSFVEATASTGRLHQIRAHLAYLDHPLVGDLRYDAPETDGADGPQLHARSVTLPHPTTRERMTFEAPLPDHRRALFEKLLGNALPMS